MKSVNYLSFFFFVSAPRFSEALSISDYEMQTYQYTNSSLVQMMNSLIDDVKLSLKDKKHKLKQFQKHHPQLYNKYFPNMLWYQTLLTWIFYFFNGKTFFLKDVGCMEENS